MEMAGLLYVSESNVKPIDVGQSSQVTLGANGHAKWFTIPSNRQKDDRDVAIKWFICGV